MSMPTLKPERHNGQDILRPYDMSGPTPKLASSSVWFPPTVSVQYPYEPIEKIAAEEAQAIVSMRAMTLTELRQRLFAFANAVIENEKRK